jgi:DNA-binding NtrC family response regulator
MTRRQTPPSDPRSRRARILVVDDYTPTLEAVVETLQLVGYEVRGLQSSLAAREAIRADPFDVIVTDYDMFGSSGLDLLVLARNVAPKTPVIVYSGSPAVHYLTGVVERGAFAFLEKPLSMSVLVGRVKEALASTGGSPSD